MAKKTKPSGPLKTKHDVYLALSEALADGDKDAFQEILEEIIRQQNVRGVAKETGLSRTSIYEAIDRSKDPRLGTICKIMAAFGKPPVDADL